VVQLSVTNQFSRSLMVCPSRGATLPIVTLTFIRRQNRTAELEPIVTTV